MRLQALNAEFAKVPCSGVIKLDWNKENGERAGGEWLLTAHNERGQVMGVLVTESTSYAEISPWLGKTASRKNAVPIWRPGH